MLLSRHTRLREFITLLGMMACGRVAAPLNNQKFQLSCS